MLMDNNQKSVETGKTEMKIWRTIIKRMKRKIIVKKSLEGLSFLRAKVTKLIFIKGIKKKKNNNMFMNLKLSNRDNNNEESIPKKVINHPKESQKKKIARDRHNKCTLFVY